MAPERDLARQRCYHHAGREAAALCLECGRYFCRECITEHEDRVICAECLAKITARAERPRRQWGRGIKVALQLALSLVVLWAFFLLLGLGLLNIPSSFHEETVWRTETR